MSVANRVRVLRRSPAGASSWGDEWFDALGVACGVPLCARGWSGGLGCGALAERMFASLRAVRRNSWAGAKSSSRSVSMVVETSEGRGRVSGCG